ncbi:mutator type transposase, partial [Tanacetum coccineum]
IGRPPKKRKKSADELSSQKMTSGGKLSRIGKTVTCDTCKKPGHNKRSCKKGVGGSAASQSASQRRFATSPRSSQRSTPTPRASQMSAANAKGKEKV